MLHYLITAISFAVIYACCVLLADELTKAWNWYWRIHRKHK